MQALVLLGPPDDGRDGAMRGIKQTEATKRRRAAPATHTRTCSPLYFIPFCRRTETEGQIRPNHAVQHSNVCGGEQCCAGQRKAKKNIATVGPGCVDEARHRHARGSASVAPVLISLWSARMTTTTIEGRVHKPKTLRRVGVHRVEAKAQGQAACTSRRKRAAAPATEGGFTVSQSEVVRRLRRL